MKRKEHKNSLLTIISTYSFDHDEFLKYIHDNQNLEAVTMQ